MSRAGTGVKERPGDQSTRVGVLRRCAVGAIVRIDGRWGVVCSKRVVDFWDGGREFVEPSTPVEVLRPRIARAA